MSMTEGKNPSGFEWLDDPESVAAQFRYVYGLAIKYAHKPQDVDDIVKEAMLKLLERKASGKFVNNPVKYMRSYVAVIIRHLVYDSNRREENMVSLEDLEVEDFAANVEDIVITSDRYDELIDALNALHPRYRDFLVLFGFHSMSVGEIAKDLKMENEQVSTVLSRARKALRKELLKRGGFYVR